MKSFIIVLLFIGITSGAYSQEKGRLDIIELPEIVIKRAGTDFSVYIPKKSTDSKINTLQEKFIAYDLGKDFEGFEEYLVTMRLKKGILAATYNANGKLIRVVENYKNVQLPSQVIYSIYAKFPQWRIINDKFLYTQEDGDIIKNQYNIKIKNGNEMRRLVVLSDGEIIKGL